MTKVKKQTQNGQSSGVSLTTLESSKPKTKKATKKVISKKKAKQPENLLDPAELLDELLKSEAKKYDETNKLQEFRVIKWKLFHGNDVVHHFLIKKHEVTVASLSKEKPPGRTILCHNVPPFLDEKHLREIFSSFGKIEQIFIHQNPTTSVAEQRDHLFPTERDTTKGFRVAYIVYLDSSSVRDLQVLGMDDIQPIVLKKPPVGGVPRWITQYNKRIVPTDVLETSIKKFMTDFDKREAERKEMEKHATEPDDEGWVTVTRSGKRSSGGLVRSEAMEKRLREKKRKQDKKLVNFTPAQIKESKLKQLLELKKKFEEDKQRVALLKQQRKFKPF